MFKFYKNWIDKKEAKENERKYRAGFDWAISDFYLEKKCVEEIQAHVDHSKIFGDYTRFDEGAEHALGIIERNERLKVEKKYCMTRKEMQEVFDEWRNRNKKAVNNDQVLTDSEYFIKLFNDLNEGLTNE